MTSPAMSVSVPVPHVTDVCRQIALAHGLAEAEERLESALYWLAGHTTRSTFDRYGIVDAAETGAAMEAVSDRFSGRFGQKFGQAAPFDAKKPHGKRS